MTFAITNTSATQSTLTQSGTDTTAANAWSGIETAVNAIPVVARATAYAVGAYVRPTVATGYLYRCTVAGTSMAAEPQFGTTAGGITTDGTASFFAFVAPVITVNGDRKTYHCPSYDFVINGTLTITNPMLETITCRTWATGAAAVYTSGTFMVDGVTSKFAGIHFTTALKGSNDFSEVSTWAGTWNIRGGTIQLAASVRPDSTLPQIFTTVTFTSSALWARSIRFRAYSTAIEFRNECRFYNIAYDAFRIPPVLSAKGFASEYVSEYVGSVVGGGTDSKMTVFSLSNQDGYAFDFDNYGGGWVEIYNCAKGAALLIVSLNNSAKHCVPLFQQLNFKVINLSGVARDGVKFTCTDAPTNSPTALITTASNLKTWDFQTPLTYTGVTAGGGLASSVPVIQVWHGTTNIKNLRFPASTAMYRFAGYNVIQQDVSVVLGSDTAQTVGVAMTAATNLTLTEAQAAALTGIALVASGADGGTVTVTAPRTLSQLWQYFRAWKPNNLSSNEWSYDGTTLIVGSWTVIGVNNLSGGELQTSTASATGSISNLIVIGNVTQATPTSLSNVTITGTLTYNTATATPVTFTNVIASTVSNVGAGVVTVKRVNSTLTASTNVAAYVPTTLTFSLSGGRIRVLNNSGVEQFNQTTDGTFELPPSAAGNWSYRIAKYGSKLIDSTFSIDGTPKIISASYIPDAAVVDTEANVTTYAVLSSTQQIYDRLALYGASAIGIADGAVATKGSGTLSVPLGLTLDAGAAAVISVVSGAVTAKTSSLTESVTVISNVTIVGATLSGLTITGNAAQATPTNLSNVTITGTLTYNTATATPVTFTNVTAGTVNNSGIGIISIKRFNSVLTAGTNVTSYAPTTLVFSLAGGRIRVLNNVGVEQYNQTTDGTFELPAAATGTWSYRIAKYGSKLIDGTVVIDGTTKTITASYIPDPTVVDTEANVTAYTDLASAQQIYDRLALYGASAIGIADGSVSTKGFGTLSVPAGLTLDSAAIALIAVSAGVVTAKSAGLAETVTLLSGGNIIAPVLSNAVQVRGLNLDSELIYSVDSLTFYPTQADRNSGTNPGSTVTGGVYRFKLGAIVSGVTLSGTVYMRVSVGATTFFYQTTLAPGQNVIDLGVQSQLSAIAAKALTLAQIEASKVLALKSDVWAAS